jgi:hypothetical protein
MNPIRTLPILLFKVYFNIIVIYTVRPSEWLRRFGFSSQYSVRISHLSMRAKFPADLIHLDFVIKLIIIM